MRIRPEFKHGMHNKGCDRPWLYLLFGVSASHCTKGVSHYMLKGWQAWHLEQNCQSQLKFFLLLLNIIIDGFILS